MQVVLCCLALLAGGDEPFLAWHVEPAKVNTLPATSGQRLSPPELVALSEGKPTLPYATPTAAVRTAEGALWVASRRGLMYLEPGAARWRLFHSRRWLPNDEVQDVALTSDGELRVKTSEGIVAFTRRQTTIEKKIDEVEDNLVKHHIRDGLVGSIHLNEAGNLAGDHEQHSNDNDGLWTSMYVAAEAFRYSVTRDPEAKKNARRSLEALMFLERITGIPGFAARSVVPIEEISQTRHGEWHRSADGKLWWKGDTSSDEVDGHYFAYQIYYDVAADEAERKEIRQYVARITDHIIDHGMYYVGPSGQPTTWGVWAPEKLNHDLRRQGDRGLNSLEILSHLKVAAHIVGNPRYAEKAKELIEKHGYGMNTVYQKHNWPFDYVNHSDDELAFLAYYPLLWLERDPELRKIYLASIRRSWMSERSEKSPFFNFIYGASWQANDWTDPMKRPDKAYVDPDVYDRQACLDWFRDVPVDTISWTVRNSERRDLGRLGKNRFGGWRSETLLPASERAVMKWNGDPYTLDGGSDGRSRDDGAAILLPYWIGRYHRFIE